MERSAKGEEGRRVRVKSLVFCMAKTTLLTSGLDNFFETSDG